MSALKISKIIMFKILLTNHQKLLGVHNYYQMHLYRPNANLPFFFYYYYYLFIFYYYLLFRLFYLFHLFIKIFFLFFFKTYFFITNILLFIQTKINVDGFFFFFLI